MSAPGRRAECSEIAVPAPAGGATGVARSLRITASVWVVFGGQGVAWKLIAPFASTHLNTGAAKAGTLAAAKRMVKTCVSLRTPTPFEQLLQSL
jgi:hypothetical protein